MPGRSRRPRCRAVTAAAALAVAAAVFADLAAGEAPIHVITLGVVTAVVAGLRVRLAGRHRRLLRFVSGCIVAQPAVHAAAELIPHGPIPHGVNGEIGPADLLVTATQLIFALAIVAVVTFAEQIVMAVTGVVRIEWRWRLRAPLPPSHPDLPRHPRTPVRAHLASRHRPGGCTRRGPPAWLAPAA